MTEQVDKGAYATQDAIGDQRTGSVGWGRGDVRSSPGAVSGREGGWDRLVKDAAEGWMGRARCLWLGTREKWVLAKPLADGGVGRKRGTERAF